MERKLATVLFVDLVDSTRFVASKDPEIVRRRVNEFFERASHCVTTHGGIVEKYAGDAVVAAFGIPQAHEDDAERAIRAALSIRDVVQELEFEARLGVESGEVVADDSAFTFATGEAVHVAARLQQAASPGEILIGPGANRLALGRVEVEDVGPLELKGLDGGIWAWRVLGARGRANGPRVQGLTAPLVGRDNELELLDSIWERAVRGRRAHLFTIFGEPGVGKSRLAREFGDTLDRATVLVGRSLPYGEGVTYWPLAEMVKNAAGIADDDPLEVAIGKLQVFCEDEAVADLLGIASGLLEAMHGQRSGQEIAWAARAWAERLAQDQPLVLIFEDIHWAEDPLLELIEDLAERVREAPLLILCLARPELLDNRPGWAGGSLRSTAIELEPLGENESDELARALLDDLQVPEADYRELLDKTQGNPLFVEEIVRMVRESEDTCSVDGVPDTLQALIAARIDRLPAAEKAVLQRAAVIGRTFWSGAISHLAPEFDDVAEVIDDLLIRDFVLPEARSTISGEEAFRFKHVLIREVAYSGLSKTGRADLHARFAEWLRERTGGELLEIRAYHLDQAVTLLEELDGAAPDELTHEAAAALEGAGKRALAREANRSARKLFVRAVELEPTLERRYQAARSAWRLSDLPAVSIEMERVRVDAEEAPDNALEARALTALAEVGLFREADVAKAEELGRAALEAADENDDEARFDALALLRTAAWWTANLSEAERYALEALAVARKTGRLDLESRAAADLSHVYLVRGDTAEAAPLVERACVQAAESGSIISQGWALLASADLHRFRDEYDEAETELERAIELFDEAGNASMLGRAHEQLARVAAKKGDSKRAERLYRESIAVLKPLEDRGMLCEAQRGLAQVLLDRGDVDQAEHYALKARETVGPQDVSSRSSTALALGLVRAAQGRDEEADALLRESLALLDPTEGMKLCFEPLRARAQFLRERGRDDEAVEFEERLAALERPDSTARIA
ncbi:MAG: AAA family ATPase [Actinomycetota bacterium]|nr:AAA family ATPase [Actinomycetota bacterium]